MSREILNLRDVSLIAKKEAIGNVIDKKFVVFLLLMLSSVPLSIYGARQLGTTPGSATSINFAIVRTLAPLLCFALSFDAISGEKSKRTIHFVLTSGPISRFSFALGKFLGCSLVPGGLFTFFPLLTYLTVKALGKAFPSLNELCRIAAAEGVILLLIATLVSIGLLASTLTNTPKASMILVVSILTLFFLGNVAGTSIGRYAIGKHSTGLSIQIGGDPILKYPWYSRALLWLDLPQHAVADVVLAANWSTITTNALNVYQHIGILLITFLLTSWLYLFALNKQDIC
jgi:ABC-type transport system involved in multi-copper enzyme maturation permease subunit